MRLMTIVAAIAATALLAGCDQHHDKTTKINTKEGTVTVSGNGEHMTMTADNGKTKVEVNTNGLGNQKLPSFAPAYPGAQVQSAVTAATEGGGMFTFELSDAPDKVIAFYKDKAVSAGLVEKMSMSANGGLTYMASAGEDKKTLQVIAAANGTGSHVQVYWADK